MAYGFEVEIKRLPGKIQWPVIYVPFSVETEFGTKGRLDIKGEIDGHPFTGTLLPSTQGHYQVMNKDLRSMTGKDLGDTVRVSLEKDEAPREVEIPEDLLAVFRVSPGLAEAFGLFPAYIKREEINRITSAKRPETREKRVRDLVGKLG